MMESQLNQMESPNVPVFDSGLELQLLASRMVSEVRKSPGHYSFTMTDRGMMEFAKAMQLAGREEQAAKMQAASNSLFPEKDSSLISKKEALEGFNVSHTTLWKWQQHGYLTPIKVGKRVYYRRTDIERLTK